MDVETRERRHVVSGLFPDWSPLSVEIVFGPSPLKLIQLEGAEVEILSTKPTILFPRWSQDGKKIAFETKGEVRILDRVTGEDVLLIDEAALPSWSPTAHDVAFWRVESGATVICAIGVDGTGYRQLTFPADYGIACLDSVVIRSPGVVGFGSSGRVPDGSVHRLVENLLW